MLVANFKSHKNTEQVVEWLEVVGHYLEQNSSIEVVVVCPEFPALAKAADLLKQTFPNVPIVLGAQNVSAFGEGKYTGEVSATALEGVVDYAIVGHSERRTLFGEDAQTVREKAFALIGVNITPIVCVSDETLNEVADLPPECVIAYEPLAAIGSGRPATAQAVSPVVEKILQMRDKTCTILYGGSVAPDNAAELLQSGVAGFLIATQSLDPQSFIGIYNAVRKSE